MRTNRLGPENKLDEDIIQEELNESHDTQSTHFEDDTEEEEKKENLSSKLQLNLGEAIKS